MKKIIGIVFLSIVLIASTVLAAYPTELENKELEQIESENVVELTSEQIQEAEKLIEEPAKEEKIEERKSDDNSIEGDLYELDEEIKINKNVNGNVYAMGQQIDVDGVIIEGNAFLFGQDIEIKNVQIEGSLYVFGENIEFSGVANDLYACGSKIIIADNSNVWRDSRICGEKVQIDGAITRNAFIAVKELTIGEKAIIGTLNYLSTNEAEISSNCKIDTINFQKQEEKEIKESVEKFNPMSYVFEILTALFKTFIIAVLIIVCIDKFNKIKRSEKVGNDFLKNAGIGALVLILAPILSIVLLFTGVASGIGIIAFLLYIVIIYASCSITSIEIATRVLDKIKKEETISNGKKIGASVLVALVVYLVGLVPVIGGIVKFAFVLIGLGIIFNLIFKKV